MTVPPLRLSLGKRLGRIPILKFPDYSIVAFDRNPNLPEGSRLVRGRRKLGKLPKPKGERGLPSLKRVKILSEMLSNFSVKVMTVRRTAASHKPFLLEK
jgi:hypothetical protein